MYGLKQFALVGFTLLSAAVAKDSTRTMVGIETTDNSKGIDVPLDDCHAIEQDEVMTVSVKKYCRVFTGPDCTGRNTLLNPGDHSNNDPVPIESIYCHATPPI